jgi:hypothetical protein
MRIISFDVGIKNMAYCIFDIRPNNDMPRFSIVEWKTVNLMNEEDTVKPDVFVCSCNNKSKKGANPKCSRQASYMKSVSYIPIQTQNTVIQTTTQITGVQTTTQSTGLQLEPPIQTIQPTNTVIYYFCDKHAKESTEWMIPNKSQTQTSLNKLSIDELQTECLKYSIESSHPLPSSSLNDNTATKTGRKKTMINSLLKFFKEKTFEPIQYKKQKNSKETDLISIGHNLRRELDKIRDFDAITNVIIENQISTLAARMNSIQGMLVQYFIMRMEEERRVSIEFISSSNKLKGLPPIVVRLNEGITGANSVGDDRIFLNGIKKNEKQNTQNTQNTQNIQKAQKAQKDKEEKDNNTPTPKNNINSKYKAHKKDGLYHCGLFLENNHILKEWKHVLNTKKKDDYADCFLQGIWYMKHHSIIKENNNYMIEL